VQVCHLNQPSDRQLPIFCWPLDLLSQHFGLFLKPHALANSFGTSLETFAKSIIIINFALQGQLAFFFYKVEL
jgi:hypothetical protein